MHTFLLWLQKNVEAAQGALLQALVYRDELQFVEAPRIRREYMEKIGRYEWEAIEKELEAVLLEKKKRMIQACLNRREEVDLEKIDAQLNRERAELLEQAGLGQVQEQHILSPEEEKTLRRLYREIVDRYHPSVHPWLSDTQKSLFEKAAEAYQHQDLAMLKLIDEMLRTDGIGLSYEMELKMDFRLLSPEQMAKELADTIAEDYTLAAELYRHFTPRKEEEILHQTAQNYLAQCKGVMDEVHTLLSLFPFSAQETLADEQKCEIYLMQVRARIAQADAEIAELKNCISQMTGESAHE